MIKLPEIDDDVKIVNSVLAPYFEQVRQQLLCCDGSKRAQLINDYTRYIEREAQRTKKVAVRIQLRINLAALLQNIAPETSKVEPNVRAKSGTDRFFDGSMFQSFDSEDMTILFEK